MRRPAPGPMTSVDLARYALVVFVALVVQHGLLDSVRIGGAHPDLTLLLPIAAGYVGGPDRGAAVGFATGLVCDLLLPTTFGLSALIGCLLGFGTGYATRGLVRSSPWLGVVSLTTATVTGLLAYAILWAVIGQSPVVGAYLASALVIDVPGAAVLALPVLWAVRWSVPAAPPSASVGALR